MEKLDEVLLNPWVSRFGNLSFIVGVALLAWNVVLKGDVQQAFVIALLALGVLLIGLPQLATRGYRLTTKVRPRIIFDDPFLRRTKIRVLDSEAEVASIEAESLTIGVKNDPARRVERATARSVHPSLTFFTTDGLVAVPSFGGRWANQQDPPGRLASGELDLPANARPETLDIAVWTNDGSVHAVDSELIRRDPSEWPFLNMHLQVGMTFLVRIQIRAVGIHLEEQWLRLSTRPFGAEKCEPPSWVSQLGAASDQ